MSQQKSQKSDGEKAEAAVPTLLKYTFGGLAAIGAAIALHPLDLIKTRMQISSGKGVKTPSMTEMFKIAIKTDGFGSLYTGLSGAILRHAIYSTTRIGVFTSVSEQYRNHFHTAPPMGASALIAMIAGITGAFVGTPADVCLVRMLTDARLPPADRRNYKNVFNALSRIVKEEGVLTLWRGGVPTIGRAVVVNTAQLASYGQFRNMAEKYMGLSEGVSLHLVASSGSGLLTATASLPVDLTKTRIQNMKVIDGKPEYKSLLDALVKTAKNEGILALWSGYVPFCTRVVPNTILIFVFLEQLNTLYFKYVLHEEYKSKI